MGSDIDEQLPGIVDVFHLLSDETRWRIIAELTSHVAEHGPFEPITFSELWDACDVEDQGRFYYHLDKLCGVFLTKRDEVYWPQIGSLRCTAAMFASIGPHKVRETELPITCWQCGRSRTARYKDEILTVECTGSDCESLVLGSIPSGAAAGQSMTDLVRISHLRFRMETSYLHQRVCPSCFNSVTSLHSVADDLAEGDEYHPRLPFRCDSCGPHMPRRMLDLASVQPEITIQQRSIRDEGS